MPDGVRQRERLTNLAKQRYGFLIAESSHGTIAASCRLTAQLEFLYTGELLHAIRVQNHVPSLTLNSFPKSGQRFAFKTSGIRSRPLSPALRRFEFRGNMKVADFFLRAKHRQVFVLVPGVYFVGQMVLLASILAPPASREGFAKRSLFPGW
jgi:hypothetical protein